MNENTVNEQGNEGGSVTVALPAGVTYFIRVGDAIKIGFASNLKKRLGSLQTSHPEKLEVLAAISARDVDEHATHLKFAHLRLGGEWFRAEKELLQFIDYAKLKFGNAEPYKAAPKRRAVRPRTFTEDLNALRLKHGAHSPIGHRCSNLAGMIPEYRTASEGERKALLAASIAKTIREIEKLSR